MNKFTLLILLLAVSASCWGVSSKELNKVFHEGNVEYHFRLKVPPSYIAKNLPHPPIDIVDKLKPLVKIDADTKKVRLSSGRYLDSRKRHLKGKNLLVRVKKRKITIKSRGDKIEKIVQFPNCDQDEREFEVDFFDRPIYSLAASIKVSKGQLDLMKDQLSGDEVLTAIKELCPGSFKVISKALKKQKLEVPGRTRQYGYHAEFVGEEVINDAIEELDFEIWSFPPTEKLFIELSYTGSYKDKAVLDQLKNRIEELLKKASLLHEKQMSKTEYYFDVYF